MSSPAKQIRPQIDPEPGAEIYSLETIPPEGESEPTRVGPMPTNLLSAMKNTSADDSELADAADLAELVLRPPPVPTFDSGPESGIITKPVEESVEAVAPPTPPPATAQVTPEETKAPVALAGPPLRRVDLRIIAAFAVLLCTAIALAAFVR